MVHHQFQKEFTVIPKAYFQYFHISVSSTLYTVYINLSLIIKIILLVSILYNKNKYYVE